MRTTARTAVRNVMRNVRATHQTTQYHAQPTAKGKRPNHCRQAAATALFSGDSSHDIVLTARTSQGDGLATEDGGKVGGGGMLLDYYGGLGGVGGVTGNCFILFRAILGHYGTLLWGPEKKSVCRG